jgi:hypothetical protein
MRNPRHFLRAVGALALLDRLRRGSGLPCCMPVHVRRVFGTERADSQVGSLLSSFQQDLGRRSLDHSISTTEAKQVSVRLVSVAATAEPQETFTLAVTLCNGSVTGLDTSGRYPVYLAYHWFTRDHTPLQLGVARASLDLLTSGTARNCSMMVTSPDTSGQYILRVTLVRVWKKSRGGTTLRG